ncbi:hypothetical protein DFH06DRAFT_973941 [Mycena polygramma]|nr:hypothetical protein DFH06DRAFT_973941 [Mycena polygramma]
MRALKPPVPLFNPGYQPSVVTAPRVPPPLPIFPHPASKSAALRQLAPPPPIASSSNLNSHLKPLVPPPPPAPTAPLASASKSTPFKALAPPPPPAYATPSSDRTMRTISTTLLARATDLFTDHGASELASIFLHDQHPDIQFPSTDDVDEHRGIMMSPEKGGKGKEKFVRNGLAARAAGLYDRSHASLSLWETEMSQFTASSASSSRRGLNPDMRLRVLHILHTPSPVSQPSSKMSIPGVALCHLLAAPTSEPSSSFHPRLKDGVYAVLFSFTSLAPPAHLQDPMQPHIRNPEDFAEGKEVYVWRPWQVLPIDPSPLKLCLETDADMDSCGEVDPEVFGLFERGATKAHCRDHLSETALVCERFVILK